MLALHIKYSRLRGAPTGDRSCVGAPRRREYDFEYGAFRNHAIIGGVSAVLFVVAVIVVVQVVMQVAAR